MVRDIEAELAERKRKVALDDIVPVVDAIMLHYVVNVLYQHFMKEHSLRADWQPSIDISVKKYLGKLPQAQVETILRKATYQANEVFGPVLKSMTGLDVRHVVIAFAQVVLTLVDQNRYRFTDDALVLQSIGIDNEAVGEQLADWNYQKFEVQYLYQGFMAQVDESPYFKQEAEHLGIAHEVLH